MYGLKLKYFILVGAAIALPAFAGSAAEEIARMNESIALLSAQKAELELRSQVAEKKIGLDRFLGAGAATMNSSETEQAPVVKRIEGIDGRLSASLLLGNGAQKIVKTGEKIPGGWTVAKIEVDSVSLVRRSEKIRLGFGNTPAPAASTLPAVPDAQRSPELPGNAGRR